MVVLSEQSSFAIHAIRAYSGRDCFLIFSFFISLVHYSIAIFQLIEDSLNAMRHAALFNKL